MECHSLDLIAVQNLYYSFIRKKKIFKKKKLRQLQQLIWLSERSVTKLQSDENSGTAHMLVTLFHILTFEPVIIFAQHFMLFLNEQTDCFFQVDIPRAFVCAESKIFDVSEWAICQVSI